MHYDSNLKTSKDTRTNTIPTGAKTCLPLSHISLPCGQRQRIYRDNNELYILFVPVGAFAILHH